MLTGGLLPQPSAAQWIGMRYLAISRLVVAALTLLFFQFGEVNQFFESALHRSNFLLTASGYVLLAAAFLLVASIVRRGYAALLIVQVVTDLIVLAVLIHFAGGQRSGLGVLAVVAVAGGAVMATPLLSMAFAAAASLLLLLEAALRVLGADAIDIGVFVAAGLTGATCFVTAWVLNRLAIRLEREEQLAAQRGEELRRQLAITQLVIAELHQGVVVVAPDGRVQTFNRVASSLLGELNVESRSMLDPALRNGWAQIAVVFREWVSWPAGRPRPDAMELSLTSESAGAAPGIDAKVKLRFLSAPADTASIEKSADSLAVRAVADAADDSHAPDVLHASNARAGRRVGTVETGPQVVSNDVVLVIEDLRALEERAQQLKLASMGRLSASIAHEIRNPLGAIRHANSLLAEQLSQAPMKRLAGIVETNTVRINRIVEDVLSISRREPATQEDIDLDSYLPGFIEEFASIAACDPQRLSWSVTATEPLRFDVNHLRQVLVNILSNALRYASAHSGAIRVEWLRNKDDRLELQIADDGPGLAAEVQQHLFEPFFTTEARGTGLGLYLAREMCSANGALLRYERLAGDGRYRGIFVIESMGKDW